jgi:hypothetical protein
MAARRGDPIHLEVDSADSSAGTAFTIYKAGSTAAYTLTATEYIDVSDIIFISTAGGTFSIVANSDAGGKRIAKGSVDAKGGLAHHFETPYTCPIGVTPKLFAAAGQVTCVLQGFVTEA